MPGAWNKILKVDLTKGETKIEELDEEYIKKYLGGNGLGIKLLHDETEGKTDAFSEENPLVFVPGALNGSQIPMTEKCGFYSRSPLTGIMAEGIFGGSLGEQVKKSGFDALVIKGQRDQLGYLVIEEDDIKIKDATELGGLGTKKTEEVLKNRHGGSAAVIGPAGENLVKFAIIAGDDREVGRTGLGAIMGWKNLKGIVVKGWKEIESAEPDRVKELKSEAFSEFTQEGGEGKESYDAYSSHGTIKFTGMASELGILPTRYWESGEFEEAEKLSSYHWEDHISESNGCHRCPCRCGQVYEDIVDVEYETSFALGSNLEIGSIEDVAKANYLCDDLGIDTLSMGNTLGFLMKLSQIGEIDEEISFGDERKIRDMIRKTAFREDIGQIAAEGVRNVGERFDREELAVHVNGLSPPAYDPRALKGMGLGFYTSTRGACHLRSDCDGIELGEGKSPDEEGNWVEMERGRKALDDKKYITWRENYVTLHDTLGSCKLTGRDVYSPEFMAKFVNAHLGLDLTGEEIYRTGERIYNLERLYNLKQKPEIKENIHVPEQFATPSPVEDLEGAKFTEDQIKRMLKDYYQARGWDERGEPKEERLKELDIEV